MAELFDLLNPVLLVATVDDGEERGGCLVGFSTQCSIEPGRLLVCLSMVNRTYAIARRARSMAVHALGPRQRDLASWFGGTTGDEVDKLDGVPVREGVTGAPVLTDCVGWMEGWIEGRVPLGDHVGYVLAPVAGAVGERQRSVLRLADVAGLRAGHPVGRSPGP